MVRSKLFSEPIGVIIDDTPAEDKEYSFACIACAKDGNAPRIMIEREFFYDVTRGSSEARVILLHELGHYYHQHLLQQNTNREQERKARIAEGSVDPNELKADCFVADYLGREKTIEGLQMLIKRICAEGEDCDPESIRLATYELQLRIKALSNE